MKYDVIIVLAGGLLDNGTLPRIVKQRIETAVGLVESFQPTKIIMSGKWSKWREKHRKPPNTEAFAMEQYATEIGMPKKLILREESSLSTAENAYHLVHQFLEPHNWKRIAIVTSDMHMRRAKDIFNRELGPSYTITYISSANDFRLFKWIEWKIKDCLFTCAKVFAKLRRLLK